MAERKFKLLDILHRNPAILKHITSLRLIGAYQTTRWMSDPIMVRLLELFSAKSHLHSLQIACMTTSRINGQAFERTIFPSVTALRHLHLYNVDDLSPSLFALLPNLETLKVEGVLFEEDYDQVDNSAVVSRVKPIILPIECQPILKSLSYARRSRITPDNFDDMDEVLYSYVNLSALELLQLHTEYRQDRMMMDIGLCRASLTLTTLQIDATGLFGT